MQACVDALQRQRVRAIVLQADAPSDGWLPALDMPVTLVVESLQVRRLSIIGEGKPRLRIERADGRFTLGDGMLDLPELRIDPCPAVPSAIRLSQARPFSATCTR